MSALALTCASVWMVVYTINQKQALRRIAIRLLPPAQGTPRTRASYLAVGTAGSR
jgi:hypothetical protein